ncbi:nuclear transport factor 2 family protein [Streptacidiphilus monticola]|uniref:Nuclear transport factor 2 family protein n=1 Tax=Streptacidiphilus monticola TaxID=2161674 RepID=A0ABW1G1V6_9ACTN
MSAAARPAFDADTLRRGIEGHTPETLLSLYRDDAEIRLVNRNATPSHPQIVTGRDAIGAMLTDVYSRDLTHKLEQCVIQGDTVAYSESCEYPDGLRVLSESMITLRDGKISKQVMIEAWDE